MAGSLQWRCKGVSVVITRTSSLAAIGSAAVSWLLVSALTACGGGGGAPADVGAPAPVAPVVPADNAPKVASQPQNSSLHPGDAAVFEVRADGTPPLQYQWERSDDGVMWATIAGANGAAFRIESASLAWAGARVRAVVSNAHGRVTSESATVDVRANVRLLAGIPGGPGYADGIGAQVRFDAVPAVVVDALGNVLAADGFNAVIRRITPDGRVTTIAGQAQQRGATDGPMVAAAFIYPQALAFDRSGNLYVGDQSVIRKIDVDGMVSTVAGTAGLQGADDGVGAAARFASVKAIVVDGAGNLIVTDGGGNQTLRRVTPGGAVTTIAGTAGLFGTTNAQGAAARFTELSAMAMDTTGDLFVTDGPTLRRVTPAGDVSLFAGIPGVEGDRDGNRLSALFSRPAGLAFDRAGNLHVATSSSIRRIAPDGMTITMAGTALCCNGDVDGRGAAAALAYPTALALTPDGSRLVFGQLRTGTVRTMSLDGTVTTIAGTSWQPATTDGPGPQARFSFPGPVASDKNGTVFIIEASGLRAVDGADAVSTLAWQTLGYANMQGLAVDADGSLVASAGQQIVRIDRQGVVTALAGRAESGHADGPGVDAKFGFPRGVAIDAAGAIFVADSGNSVIRKVDAAGRVTTIAGAPGSCGHRDGSRDVALLCHPAGLAFDSQGRLYVSDDWSDTIRRIDSDGNVVTIGGLAFSPGFSEGSASRFIMPGDLAFDADDNLYVADVGNSVVRRLSPSGFVSTVMGQRGTWALHPGPGGAINRPTGLTMRPGGRLIVLSEMAVVGD